ncbi:MAG TPA: tetratricopeptide repeat protein [Nevskia sp.]|jgi:Flp pilus assembly protein TadD|nr:tetratricopeptide repeat protein [Nevskia sp.]
MTRTWWLLPAVLLAACSSTARHPDSGNPAEAEAPHVSNQDIHADLIQQMLDKGQYYAALAHIEDQKRSGSSEQLTLLEADARRHLGQRAQSEALYRSLLDSRYSAQAYHGLGMLYTNTDLEAAIRNLRRAVERAPTDVDFRNDLGYALMTAGRYNEAMPELSTAAELAPGQMKSRNNLIILMLLVGNEGAAQRLAQDADVKADGMRQLRDSAQAIRNRQNARTAKAAG